MYRLDTLIFLSWDVLEFLQGPLHHPGSQASVRGTEWSYRLAVSLHPVGRNVPWTSRPSVGCLVWRALPSLCGFSGSGGRCLLFPLGCLGIRFPFSPNRVASLFTPCGGFPFLLAWASDSVTLPSLPAFAVWPGLFHEGLSVYAPHTWGL